MIWLLRLFGAFRDLQNLAATQAEALESEIRAHEETKTLLHDRVLSLEAERIRRIAAETVASERREEIDRLVMQHREMREDLARVNSERLKSVDAINIKLMREGVVEPPPDMDKYKTAPRAQTQQGRTAAHLNGKFATDLLRTHHPSFQAKPAEPEAAPIDGVVV